MAEVEQQAPVVDPKVAEAEMLTMQEFDKEIKALLGKYKFGIGAEAFLMHDGRVSARPVIVKVKEEEKVEEGKSEITPA